MGVGDGRGLVGSRMDEPLMAGPHSPRGREEKDPLLLGMEHPRRAHKASAFCMTSHQTSTAMVPIVQRGKLRHKEGNAVNAGNSQ